MTDTATERYAARPIIADFQDKARKDSADAHRVAFGAAKAIVDKIPIEQDQFMGQILRHLNAMGEIHSSIALGGYVQAMHTIAASPTMGAVDRGIIRDTANTYLDTYCKAAKISNPLKPEYHAR